MLPSRAAHTTRNVRVYPCRSYPPPLLVCFVCVAVLYRCDWPGAGACGDHGCSACNFAENFSCYSLDLGAAHADANYEIDIIVAELMLRYQGERTLWIVSDCGPCA